MRGVCLWGGVHLEVSTYGRPLHMETYFVGDVLYTVCVLECSSIYILSEVSVYERFSLSVRYSNQVSISSHLFPIYLYL